MADKTLIEWTQATWNPVTGCAKVSQGCKHCYAEREWPRMTKLVPAYAGRDFTDVRTHVDRLDQPLRWRRPRRIFVNSMSDLFHQDVPDEFIAAVFGVMAACPQHTFQVLTKRPDRMLAWFKWHASRVQEKDWRYMKWRVCEQEAVEHLPNLPATGCAQPWPLPNVWLGVSVEDQTAADERIPLLLATPAAVRWISAEPLLGPVDLSAEYLAMKCGGTYPFKGVPDEYRTKLIDLLDWVVVGGESGPKARPMHPGWVRSLRDQCASAGVPFLFKQWGEWATCYSTSDGTPVFRTFDSFQQWVNKASSWVAGGICLDRLGRELKNGGDMATAHDRGDFPVTIMHRVGRKAAGRLLDGVLHDGYPACPK